MLMNSKINNTILITYVYFESQLSKINLHFFIENGVFESKTVHYNFIIKSRECSIDIPNYDNIKVYYIENKGYDFIGYSYSVEHPHNNVKEYDYYIFLNDTVRGPFLPRYISKSCWVYCFIQLINEKTKLVGISINRYVSDKISKHVQSMGFATDLKGIRLLQDKQIFNIKKNREIYNKFEFIIKFEVGMSKVFLEAGYLIDSFMQVENMDGELKHGDIHHPNKYYGITLNPIEIMFIKVNRINNLIVQNYTKWNISSNQTLPSQTLPNQGKTFRNTRYRRSKRYI